MKKIERILALAIVMCTSAVGCDTVDTNCCPKKTIEVIRKCPPPAPKVEEKVVIVQPPSPQPAPAPSVTVITRYVCGVCKKEFTPTKENPYCMACMKKEEIVVVNPPVRTPTYEQGYGQFYQTPVYQSPGYFQPSMQFPTPMFPQGFNYEYNSNTHIRATTR